MGLIKAITGAAGGVLADQWKEYFYCDSLPADTLVIKGSKRVSGRSSNTKASDNIITADSVIAVADGQCMIIVEQGAVVEVCAEPGEFVFESSSEPSFEELALKNEQSPTLILERSVIAMSRPSKVGRHFRLENEISPPSVPG